MTGRHYTPDELAKIRELAERGHGATAIAAQLAGRSAGGVQGQLVRMGFVDPRRSTSAKERRQREMTVEQHRTFREFLRSNIVRMPPIELMRRWNEDAPRRGCPPVSIDMVDYWVDKLRIRLSPQEAAANESYLRIRRRRYEKRSETARHTHERKADVRRRKMSELRQRLVASKNSPKKWRCSVCDEAWPLTADFYRAKRDNKRGQEYLELNACILCANRHRRRISRLRSNGHSPHAIRDLLKQEERQRRDAKAESVVAAARELRAQVLAKSPRGTCRSCAECGETWPLRREFWQLNSTGACPRFCRFCDSRYRREQKRARADGRSVAEVREARRELRNRLLAQQRLSRRETMEARARKLLDRSRPGPSRECKLCFTVWPLTDEFWLFESPDGPRAGKLSRLYCRCCSNDKDAYRNRHRQR